MRFLVCSSVIHSFHCFGLFLFDYLSVGVFNLCFLLFIRVDVPLHVLSFFCLVVINSVDKTKLPDYSLFICLYIYFIIRVFAISFHHC